MEILSKDFVEFIESCVERDVRFLIVGGYALAAHGHPRATKDLDVWVVLERRNAERLINALGDFGFGSVGLTAEDFMEPDSAIQLGYPPMRIDLLTTVSGVDFEGCWDRRMMVRIGDVDAGFISFDDLVVNKTASARPQDLVDVDTLQQLRQVDSVAGGPSEPGLTRVERLQAETDSLDALDEDRGD